MTTPTTEEPADTGGPPARRPLVHVIWAIVGWAIVAAALTVLVLRWRGAGHPLTIALVGLTALLAAPLAVGAVAALLSRSPALRVATAVVIALFFVTVSPVHAVVGCGAASGPDALTIYTHNVYFARDGGRPDDIAASIAATDPDIVVLQEVRWPFFSAIQDDPRLAYLRHRSDSFPDVPYGSLVWSRWPITEARAEAFVVSELITADIATPSGDVTLSAVHTLAPNRPAAVRPWQAQFEQLALVDTTAPAVMAGDFNATDDHRPFRDLLGSGWTDVHGPKGCGFDATWPVGRLLPFPVMRLDHVLVTDHFEVLDVRFADPGGSDHKPVVASVRLR